MSDDTLWIERSGPAMSHFIMQFRSSFKNVLAPGLAVSTPCEAVHIICDSYIDKSLKEGEKIYIDVII